RRGAACGGNRRRSAGPRTELAGYALWKRCRESRAAEKRTRPLREELQVLEVLRNRKSAWRNHFWEDELEVRRLILTRTQAVSELHRATLADDVDLAHRRQKWKTREVEERRGRPEPPAAERRDLFDGLRAPEPIGLIAVARVDVGCEDIHGIR